MNSRYWFSQGIFPSAVIILITGFIMSCNEIGRDYRILVERGEFTAAEEAINDLIEEGNLSPEEKYALSFESERLDRIRLDFNQDKKPVHDYIRKYIPGATAADFERWETTRAIELMVIDGVKKYFHSAGRNFFRIDPEVRIIWKEAHSGGDEAAGSGEAEGIDVHNAGIIAESRKTGNQWVKPVRLRIKQGVSVPAGEVPDGETIRCWIPYPREIAGRQDNIKLISSQPAEHILAPADQMQRTIYLEKTAVADQKADFFVEYEYTTRGTWTDINPELITGVDSKSLDKYLAERPPHIVFTPELRAISEKVVGDEGNPYQIAKKLFEWVDENIPWASAREYSTIPNIPAYAVKNNHGDCGIQTLTFMTLCRMNGIPTRWQSGWEFKPPDDSMHDWGMIYFEPYGWVPMDVTYGVRSAGTEEGKWFYVSGMDSYRTIYNDDYGQQFYPAKIHHRSEPLDSQRGEVEWRGGNLYFDRWKWSHDWEIIEQ